jgi:transcriptional regulator GlxA family with amidase domain
LLDGRPATTHWAASDRLRNHYPNIDVQPNRIFVDDGDILTSAGVTAGIDLCLHLIRIDCGAAAANERARALVAPPRRSGDQAQYVDRLRGAPTGDKLASLRQWMLENLSESMTIDALAAQAHMSRRSLIRHFRTETGTSPMAWLTEARIDRARELLETTAEPIEQIGRLAGLGSPASGAHYLPQTSRHLPDRVPKPVPTAGRRFGGVRVAIHRLAEPGNRNSSRARAGRNGESLNVSVRAFLTCAMEHTRLSKPLNLARIVHGCRRPRSTV